MSNNTKKTPPPGPPCFGHFGQAYDTTYCAGCSVVHGCQQVSPASALLRRLATLSAGDRQVAGDHYKEMGVEPWDVIDTWPLEQRIGAYRAGELKYLMRMGSKDARLQEIRKGGHYNEKLAEVLAEAGAQEVAEQQQADADHQALLQRILDAYSPDDTIHDYQDKIRGLFGPNAPGNKPPTTGD